MVEESLARTHEVLTRGLELAHAWYRGMVDPSTGMLEYLHVPGAAMPVREKSPIRDIASVWDAALLEDFLKRSELRPLIERSLRYYEGYLVPRDDHLILDSRRLAEPASIAHSAFMILGLLHAPPPRRDHEIAALAAGILRQQRPDGSYKVFFEDLPDYGEELYCGEAMLALMETYRQFQEDPYRRSVEHAFSFYDAEYFGRGSVTEDTLVFFANWQSQSCRLLSELSSSAVLKQEIARYLYRMHDQIVRQGFYESVRRHPARHVSVEVACALEGLNDAYALARASGDPHVERYHACICTGLAYLLRLQRTKSGTEKERGGFGMSLDDRTQRIDVTGHAISALMKSLQNGIECSSAQE